MATNTSNYNWTKPSYEDAADIEVINVTIDSIDEQVKANDDKASTALVELVDSGAKNLLKYTSNGGTSRGVTVTINSDGTVSVSGTATGGNASIVLAASVDGASVPEGNYILSGAVGGSDNTYRLQFFQNNTTISAPDGGTEIYIENPTTYEKRWNVAVFVKEGYTANNLVIKPMICSKAAWDISQQYQPYRPSYQELYEMILALQ